MTGIKNTRHYKGIIRPAVTAVDIAIVNASFLMAILYDPEISAGSRLWSLFLILNAAFLPSLFFFSSAIVSRRTSPMDHVVAEAVKRVLLQALIMGTLLYVIPGITLSPATFCRYLIICIIALPAANIICRATVSGFRSMGYNYVRCVIVGTNETARRLAENMAHDPGYGFKILGFFDVGTPRNFYGNYLGTIDSLEKFVIDNKIDEIYFALSGENPETVVRVMKIAEDHVAKFYYVPRISRYINRSFLLQSLGTSAVLATHPTPLSSRLNSVMKRTFDIAVSATALILSPIIVIPVAVAIKISSPGPVFFRQKRTGLGGKIFTCYKFRTMCVNSDSDTVQAAADDPRKTYVGDFLRRNSIDELPQLLNVLLGDMSIVGPRPHMLKITEDYTKLIDMYMVRHIVKPGITGWAQVNGYRGSTPHLWQMAGRVERDVWYIENWSFMLDLKIIAMTVVNLFRGEKNAY